MQTHVDFLVVGGGPVGLTMACELLRFGQNVRIVEKKLERDPWSKAAAIVSRTMETFEYMGVIGAFLEQGVKVKGANMMYGTDTLGRLQIEPANTQYDFMMGLNQIDTEMILEEHLQNLGGTLERGLQMKDFEEEDDIVRVTILKEDGTEEVVTCHWLLGCDGARSTIRKKLGLQFEGDTFEQILAQADVKVEFPFEVRPNEAYMFLGDTGPCGFLPLFGEGRYRAIMINPPSWEGDEIPYSLVEELVMERCPEGVRISEPTWFTHFHFHGRLAERYNVGRVFLAGDAAHVHSPVGGQGMNMGIQDAFNLAWKLQLVHQGLAPIEFLDSYEQERKPVGEAVVNATDKATKTAFRAMTLQNKALQSFRNRMMGVMLNSGILAAFAMPAISQLKINYRTSSIVDEFRLCGGKHRIDSGRDSEVPTVADGFLFNKAPSAGERVSDLEFHDQTLFDYLNRKKHVLLLFDGYAATTTGYQNLAQLASEVQSRYSEQVDTVIVVPYESKPVPLQWDGEMLFDAGKDLHDHFGSHSEAIYLIRPDGYVGYRSQPAEATAFLEYLSHLFTC